MSDEDFWNGRGNKRSSGWSDNNAGYQRINNNVGGEGDEYSRLANLIENNIKQINLNVSKITTNSNLVGTNKDSAELRDEIYSLIKATAGLATSSADALKQFCSPKLQGPDPQEKKKLQSRLRDDLERALQRYKEISQSAKDKIFSAPEPKRDVRDGGGKAKSAWGQGSDNSQNKGRKQDSFNLGPARPYNEEEEEDLERQQQQARLRQQFIVLDDESNFQDAIIQDREAGIMLIEKGMQELNNIFIDLAKLVEEQDVMFQHLDDHISASVSNVSRGVSELRTAQEYQKSGRNCTCILLIIVTAFVAVVIVLLVVGLTVIRSKF